MSFQVKVPSVGESIQEGMIHKWHVKDGDFVNVDDILAELETDKATVEIVAEKSGAIQIAKKEGDTVQVGESIATIDTNAKGAPKPATKVSENKATEVKASLVNNTSESLASTKPNSTQDLSPAVRKIVSENSLQPENISGSGRGGRLTKEDVLRTLAAPQPEKPSAQSKQLAIEPASQKAPTHEIPHYKVGSRDVRREKMTMIRKTIAKHLVASQQTAAMLTTFNEVDMSALLELRKKYKETFEKRYGVGLGFMGFFLKATVAALQEFPRINAYIEGEEIIYHDYCDIGVAVSSDRGLLVPVVRNVESMSIVQIESAISDLAQRARIGKIGLDELSGGTFTVSNGGVFGSLMSTPILNAPQSGILGMHKIEKRPVVVNDQIVVRQMMYLALSYDHRIVDGKEAVQFLVKIKDCIEDPQRLLLDV